MTGRVLAWTFVAAGLVAGGVGGSHRFDQLVDPLEQCDSCHVGESADLLVGRPCPHSVDYRSICHSCHVLGLEGYVAATYGTVGLAAPRWSRGLEDPLLGGQDCLTCHAQIGRPDMDCGLCHGERGGETRKVASCGSCHVRHTPLPPHAEMACEGCHLETLANPMGMSKMMLTAEERQRDARRRGTSEQAGTTMRTKDQVPLPGEESPR